LKEKNYFARRTIFIRKAIKGYCVDYLRIGAGRKKKLAKSFCDPKTSELLKARGQILFDWLQNRKTDFQCVCV